MLPSGFNRPREALNQFLDDSADVRPEGVAIEEPGCGEISYRELASLSDQLYRRLYQLGVRPGDRVGIYLRKSIDAVASIFGILKAGAAYVPVDPSAPAARNAYILNDCAVKVVITQQCFEKGFRAEARLDRELPHLLLLEATGGGLFLKGALGREGDLVLPEKTTLPRHAQGSHLVASKCDQLYPLVFRDIQSQRRRTIFFPRAFSFRSFDSGYFSHDQAWSNAHFSRRRNR